MSDEIEIDAAPKPLDEILADLRTHWRETFGEVPAPAGLLESMARDLYALHVQVTIATQTIGAGQSIEVPIRIGGRDHGTVKIDCTSSEGVEAGMQSLNERLAFGLMDTVADGASARVGVPAIPPGAYHCACYADNSGVRDDDDRVAAMARAAGFASEVRDPLAEHHKRDAESDSEVAVRLDDGHTARADVLDLELGQAVTITCATGQRVVIAYVDPEQPIRGVYERDAAWLRRAIIARPTLVTIVARDARDRGQLVTP